MLSPQALDPDFDSSGYGLIDLGPAKPDLARERWLFIWVLMQALIDVGMIQPVNQGRRAMPKNPDNPDTHAARNWLLHNKADFFTVCELAGIEPFLIRTAVRKWFNTGAGTLQ